MEKLGIFGAVVAAVSLASGAAFAADADMEKCVVMKDGKNIVKESKGDCKGSKHDCAGKNNAGDADAFIMVPKGQCHMILSGDFSGVSKDIKNKIESTK